MSILNRIRQFSNAANAEIFSTDVDFIRKYLNKQEQVLFYRMPIADQRHSLDVAYNLVDKIKYIEEKRRQPLKLKEESVVAALLHDVGKINAPFSLFSRVSYIIVKKLFKNLGWELLLNLGKNPSSWLLFRNFYILEFHHLIGANLLKQVDSNPEVINMVGHHQGKIKLEDPIVLNLIRELDQTN